MVCCFMAFGYCLSQLRLPKQTPQAGWFKHRNLFLTGLKVGKSEIKVPSNSVPGEDLPESHLVLIMQIKARLSLVLFL